MSITFKKNNYSVDCNEIIETQIKNNKIIPIDWFTFTNNYNIEAFEFVEEDSLNKIYINKDNQIHAKEFIEK